jgi:hypothetical protein
MANYLFLDEAGNFDFGPSGTPWLMVAAIVLDLSDARTAAVSRLRFAINNEGVDLAGFHASANTPSVRRRFAELLRGNGFPVTIYVCAVDKRSLAAAPDPAQLYQRLVSGVLGMAEAEGPIDMIYADSIPLQRYRRAIQAAISEAMGRRPVRFHPSHSLCELQVVDFACWACWRHLTKSDTSPIEWIGSPKVEIQVIREK